MARNRGISVSVKEGYEAGGGIELGRGIKTENRWHGVQGQGNIKNNDKA